MALLSDLSPPERPAGLMERWYRFRDRTMRRPDFQRWAARFPLTRPIARQRQRDLFDLVSGFVYSQILQACVRLKVFEALADGPRTVGDLAMYLNLKPDMAHRLLADAAGVPPLER